MNSQSKRLLTGDLIFVESSELNLSGAISRVTSSNISSISYDHLGIVEKHGKNVYILHATTDGGSKKESLSAFKNSHIGRKLVVYRLKEPFRAAIPDAIHKANNMLGKPYNYLYVRTDTAYYCSDYIQRAFSADEIFKLEPMTFVNPETGNTDVYWENFYNSHNHKIPEGELGCNPNGLSKSPKIEKLFILK